MKIKAITWLGAAGLLALAGWWWSGPIGQPADRVTTEAATVAPPAASPPLPAPSQLPPQVAPPLDLTTVPVRVRPVVDVCQEFWSRLAVVHGLGNDLEPQELASLYAFLRIPEVGEVKIRGGEHVLKNDLLNILRRQADPPAGLARLLIELSRDPAQDRVMRAYALQHIRLWYSPWTDQNSPAAATEPERVAMRQALWDAVKDPDPTVTGTALVNLHHLSHVHAEFDPEQISATALTFSEDEACGALARSTALQICAERKLDQVLPTILKLAQGADNIPLQISAIAALGSLGGSVEVRFLEQLAAGENERLKGPARAALKQIQQRRLN